jgi:uncharacterized protein (TIGR00369 family)
MLEQIQRMKSGELPLPPIFGLIGFKLTKVDPGQVVCTMESDPERQANPMGTIHGGVLCDLADAAMGLSFASTLAADESFTTLELKINFLRPVWRATLTAEGRVVSRGRTVGLVECSVVDEQGRLIAKATSTCLTLRGEQARGR